MDESRSFECVWVDPTGHPQCPHGNFMSLKVKIFYCPERKMPVVGPTLLFNKHEGNKHEQFYACSACRDRDLCKFFLKHGEELSKKEIAKWEKERKRMLSQYPHQKMFIRFNEILGLQPVNRCYCHTCERFVPIIEKEKHTDHEKIENITDYQMSHPTEILKPLDNTKKEAQYLFSKKSTEEISKMLVELGAKQVICIGAPRIYEYFQHYYQDSIASLLLDIDGRFHNFFGPLNFCWYNLFNHHFPNHSAADVFKDFITLNGGKDTYLICDPPFGGRVEPMSWTVKKISDLHKKWNNISDENECLKVMFIFPYYMEPILRQKSNPPGVSGGLKELTMSDYKVDYDNHPLFVTEAKGNKKPSPVRIFTNIPLKLLELPVRDGYWYCKKCEKWVAKENKHCKKCKECTSKDSRRYKHCNVCERCVKPTWKHCEKCQRCTVEKHNCGSKPRIIGKCFKCGEAGHIERDCTLSKENGVTKIVTETKNGVKRKITREGQSVNKKLKMIDTSNKLSKAKSTVKAVKAVKTIATKTKSLIKR